MTKKDLKSGMIVETRNKEEAIVMIGVAVQNGDVLVSRNGWTPLDKYNDDLTFKGDNSEDIVKVSKPLYLKCIADLLDRHSRSVIWERKVKEMTQEEIEKVLGYPIKIVKKIA